MKVRPVSVEYYREQAKRLRGEAENAHDLVISNELRNLAQRYEVLANGVEQLSVSQTLLTHGRTAVARPPERAGLKRKRQDQ